MVTNIEYTNIRRVLDEIHRHPLLSDVTLEQVVSYMLVFIRKFGFPKIYVDKEIKVDIKDFRGLLPCDLVSINQVKELKSGICLRSMTDTFNPHDNFHKHEHSHDYEFTQVKDLSYKTQGRVIFTSFKHGEIIVSYKAIPVDEDGFPLLIDNPLFIETLKQYVKVEAFTILFDMGKITAQILSNAQAQYANLAAELNSEFTIPSVDEMESITSMWNTLIPRVREHRNGFRNLGTKEYIKGH
jgi:hypothetical protein